MADPSDDMPAGAPPPVPESPPPPDERRPLPGAAVAAFAVTLVVVIAAAAVLLPRGDGGTERPRTSSAPATPAPAGASASSTSPGVPPVPAGRTVSGPTPCPQATGEARASRFAGPPPLCIDVAKAYTAVFTTTAGVVRVELDTARTPMTTNNFVVLARYGYYDGTSFMRTDTSIDIIQGGAPTTQSISDPGPGYTIDDEGGRFTYAEGGLTMARSGRANSASAQYFFSAGPKTSLLDAQGTYVTFGQVVEGLEILRSVLASHASCPPGSRACLGGAPQPPVAVTTVTVEERGTQ